MNKILPVVLSVLLIAAFAAGCGCSGTATPSPSPSAQPTGTPITATLEPIMSEEPSMSPDAAAGTTPDASASSSPDASASIPNFQEGTEVKIDELPEIKKAIEDKYPNATIKTVKHATKENQQLYSVELTTGGTTTTVYVLPDGTLYEASTPNP